MVMVQKILLSPRSTRIIVKVRHLTTLFSKSGTGVIRPDLVVMAVAQNDCLEQSGHIRAMVLISNARCARMSG